MSNKFLQPLKEQIPYRSSHHKNKPVNLNLCIVIEKCKIAWYPDNNGRPGIAFIFGVDDKGRYIKQEWMFESEKQRDEFYQGLLTNQSKPADKPDLKLWHLYLASQEEARQNSRREEQDNKAFLELTGYVLKSLRGEV